MYTFTFLRHGQSVGNVTGQFQGQYDFPLTAQGSAQAQALADYWEREGTVFDGIICSPLKRATETAEILAASLGMAYELDPLWMERDNGVLGRLSQEEAGELYPRPDFIPLYQPVGKTGESEWQLYLRAGRAIHSLFKRPAGHFLIVSHEGLLNKVMHGILGVNPHANFQGLHFSFSNTGHATLKYNRELPRWEFHTYNDCQHLEGIQALQSAYEFTFLRHGFSEGNQQRLFQGQADCPLTPEGEGQAQSLADRWQLEGKTFDRILSSPLQRAHLTAQIIGQKLDLPVHTDPLLKEVNNGGMTGMNLDEIDLHYPERLDRQNTYSPIGGTGESWFGLFLRGGEIVQNLFQHPPGRYLIVSHGAILNGVLQSIFGSPPRFGNSTPAFYIPNTGFAHLGYSPNKHLWRIHSLNDQAHVKELEIDAAS